MPDRSDAIAAAVRALCGDPTAMPSCPHGSRRARRTLLHARWRRIPRRPDDAALARLVGTPAGRAALQWWAEVAPAGWEHAHAEALIDSVQRRRCNPIVAAALIGPDDAFAALLHAPNATSFAIRMRVLSPLDAAGRCESDAP